jgi:hypothetical protein
MAISRLAISGLSFGSPKVTSALDNSLLAGKTPSVEVLVVAGGGGGGTASGGGGAGGVLYNSSFSITPGTSYTVDIGGGGAVNANGENSSFGDTVIAIGGGKGGTGATALGSAYHVLQTNSANNALEFSDSGIRRMVVFTGSGTYTKTAGARYALVQVQGPGGGASGHGESGAAGGYAERLVDISGISTVSVTINGGGGGTYYSGAAGNAGGSCSFGPYVSASGGHGANRHNQHNGGLPGVGSGGDLNIYGGAGGGHEQRSSGMGGSSFFGGAAPAGHPQGGNFAHNHQGHAANGTGGTSGYFSGHRGSDGRPGMIVITEYF